MNTRVEYLYRDAGNFKQFASVVLEGEITTREREAITAALDSGEYFIPSQVGLADLLTPFPDPDLDHVWHELDVRSGITLTGDAATCNMDVHRFASMFTGQWDVIAAIKRLGLPPMHGR